MSITERTIPTVLIPDLWSRRIVGLVAEIYYRCGSLDRLDMHASDILVQAGKSAQASAIAAQRLDPMLMGESSDESPSGLSVGAYRSMIEFIRDESKSLTFSASTLHQLQRMLTLGIPDYGGYRSEDAKQLLHSLCQSVNALIDDRETPILVAPQFLAEFTRIQPFRSANGRIAVLGTILILLQGGVNILRITSLESAIVEHADAFRNALRPDAAPEDLSTLLIETLAGLCIAPTSHTADKEPADSIRDSAEQPDSTEPTSASPSGHQDSATAIEPSDADENQPAEPDTDNVSSASSTAGSASAEETANSAAEASTAIAPSEKEDTAPAQNPETPDEAEKIAHTEKKKKAAAKTKRPAAKKTTASKNSEKTTTQTPAAPASTANAPTESTADPSRETASKEAPAQDAATNSISDEPILAPMTDIVWAACQKCNGRITASKLIKGDERIKRGHALETALKTLTGELHWLERVGSGRYAGYEITADGRKHTEE